MEHPSEQMKYHEPKRVYGLPDQPFYIDEDVLAYFRKAVEAGRHLQEAWKCQPGSIARPIKKNFSGQLTIAGQTIDVNRHIFRHFEPERERRGIHEKAVTPGFWMPIATDNPGVKVARGLSASRSDVISAVTKCVSGAKMRTAIN